MPNSIRIRSIGLLCMLVLLNHKPLSAQSIPIDVSGPRDSLADQFLKTEKILSNSFPNLSLQPISAGKLVRQLQSLGLPVVIHQSAIDDSLDHDTILRLPLPSERLGAQLLHVLDQHNATLAIDDGLIRIISRDDAETDPRYLTTMVYDVTTLGGSPRKLIDTIENSVESESWLDTGSGLGTIQAIQVGQRNLLVVGQTYDVHRKLHQLLSDLHLAGGIAADSSPQTVRKRSIAKPVVVPKTRTGDLAMIRVAASSTRPCMPRGKKHGGGGGGVF